MQYSEKLKTGSSVVDQVVQSNWELIDGYVKRSEEAHISQQKEINAKLVKNGKSPLPIRPFTESEKELSAVLCIADFAKALAKYIKKDDKLVEDSMSVSKGLIEGYVIIERDGEQHRIDTHSIYASGDIQRLHIRYLVNSSLPRIREEILDRINDQKKKLTKAEKIREEINLYRNYKKDYEEKLVEYEKLTIDDIRKEVEKQYQFNPSSYQGDDMPGHVHKNKETFNSFIDDVIKDRYESNNSWIRNYKNSIKNIIKSIDKLEKKLAALD